MKPNLGTMVVISVDGATTESTIDISKSAEFLATVHEILDDYLELVPRFLNWQGHRCVAFCGENGKLKQRPVNGHATYLWWRHGVGMGDCLVGPVVIVYGPPAFMEAL